MLDPADPRSQTVEARRDCDTPSPDQEPKPVPECVAQKGPFSAGEEASIDAIVGQTLDGTVLSWSAGAERLYGYRPDEIVGRSAILLMPLHQRDALKELLAPVRQGRTLPSHVMVHLKKGGVPVLVHLSLSPIRDAGGEVVGASMIAREIAEEEQTGSAIRIPAAEVMRPLTEIRYVTSHARCLLWHGTVTDWGRGPGAYQWRAHVFDEEAAQAFMPLDLLPGENYTGAWYRHRLPEDQRLTDRLSAEALHENRPSYSAEFGCRGRDGRVGWFDERVYVEPLPPPPGALGHWRVVGVAIDITERKRAEEELRSSEEQFRQLAENIQEVFWLFEPAGRVGSPRSRRRCGEEGVPSRSEMVYISPAYEEIWGRSRESLYQDPRSFLEAVHPEDREEVSRSLERQTGGECTVQEYRVIRPDGSVRWVQDRAFPILDAAGSVYRIAGIAADITHRKHVEAELRQANQAKDEFLAMLAHELRNPLGAIRNALEVMDRASPDAPAHRRALDVVKRQVQLQTRIVSDLLDVSRITRGSLQLQREPIEFGGLCRHAVEDLRIAFQSAGLALSLELPEEPIPLIGDPARLTQVLVNLLDNARKFTEPGGHVTVRVVPHQPPGRVELAVTDTGLGIAPDLLPHVFEVFTQAEQTLARSRGGLGLGLALVKGLVGQHGGEVTAQSEGLGRGATFTVWLPLSGGAERRAKQTFSRRSNVE